VHLPLQVLGDEVEITEQGASVFQPAPRITEADHRKDTKSLQRALDKRLFLLVKAQGGTFPFTAQCSFSLSEMCSGENDTSSDPQSILQRSLLLAVLELYQTAVVHSAAPDIAIKLCFILIASAQCGRGKVNNSY